MSTTHHHGGLQADLAKLPNAAASRRRSLRWLSPARPRCRSTAAPAMAASSAACPVIPEETGGPYPGDGTNANHGKVAKALALSGIVRPDIRWSVAGASGVALGVPLTIELKIVNVAAACASAAGATAYLWHCDRDGNYAMYSSAISAENYLRGMQVADADGVVTFTAIFPGCYDGRMPHVHFEVYPTLATGYSASLRKLSRISVALDNVFSDGTALQMPAMRSGMVNGYVATLAVGVSL